MTHPHQPSTSHDDHRETEVLVVGGGVAGVSLLYALTARGVPAMLIDKGTIGSQGASSIPAALLNPHRGRTGRATPLDVAGLATVWQWAERLEAEGAATGAHRSGVLRIASSARQRELWRRLEGPLPLTSSDFPAHVSAKFGGMLVADGGWLEPRRWLAALTRTAVAGGAVVAEGTELLALSGTGTSLARTSRTTVSATEVVLCLGAYDADTLRLPRLETAPGLAVGVALAAQPAGEGATVPIAGTLGIVFTGAGAVISGTAHSGDGADVERLVAAASWFVPGVAGAEITGVWRGTRARRPSGVPVVRRLRGGLTLFGALGGRGFLCSALLAEALAKRLATRLAER